MFWGEVRFTTSMLFSLAFMITFVIGGMSGIILATPPLDYMVHNTVFLVAHFHNMLIPGMLFGVIAGYIYWFPKAFGFRLSERWGRIAFFCWVPGFYIAFMPLYVMGASGMTRRSQELFDPALRPWLIIALAGALMLFAGLLSLFIQLWVSIKERQMTRVPVGDPWDARGLEWSVSAPPPEYNFAVLPHVSRRDAFHWRKKYGGAYKPADNYRDIELPKNSMCGVLIGFGMTACSMGLVWHIWWLAFGGLALSVGTVVARSFMRDVYRTIPAAEVEAEDRRWLEAVASAVPIPRQLEMTQENEGLAKWQD
jgi:cytochrome o ubiquinol oxidase subunit I